MSQHGRWNIVRYDEVFFGFLALTAPMTRYYMFADNGKPVEQMNQCGKLTPCNMFSRQWWVSLRLWGNGEYAGESDNMYNCLMKQTWCADFLGETQYTFVQNISFPFYIVFENEEGLWNETSFWWLSPPILLIKYTSVWKIEVWKEIVCVKTAVYLSSFPLICYSCHFLPTTYQF